MIDQLEARIRAKPRCSMKPDRIVQQVEQNNVLGSDTLPCMIEPAGAGAWGYFCIYKENKRGKEHSNHPWHERLSAGRPLSGSALRARKSGCSVATVGESVLPIVEQTRYSKRAIGEVTDVVEKEMYTFEAAMATMTLRPEGTAGCACRHRTWSPVQSRTASGTSGQCSRHERPAGSLPPVPPDRRRSVWPAGPGHRRGLIMLTARWWRELEHLRTRRLPG